MENAFDQNGGMSDEEYLRSVFPKLFQERNTVAPALNGTADQPAAQPDAAPRARPAAPEAPYRPATGTISDEDLAKQSWPQYLSGAAQNLPGSAKRQVSNIADAVYNYDQTIPALAGLGKGALSKAAGALGFEQDREQKAQAEAGVDALMADYGQAYKGLLSGDTAALQRTFYEDPARVGMDFASVAPVIGPAGRAVGMGKKAATAASALSMLDPVQATLATAKTVAGKPMEYIAKGVLSKTSGAPRFALDVSENIGRGYKTKAESDAAKAAYSSGATAENIADTFEKSFGELGDQARTEYRRQHGILPNAPIPVTEVDGALDGILTQMGGPSLAPTLFPDEYAVLQRMKNTVASKPNWNAVELDLLKKSFDDDIGKLSRAGSKFRGAFAEAPRSIINSIGTVHPEYAKMLRGWQDWLEKARNLQQNFGKAGRASDASIMSKLLKGMKTPNGANLINDLKNTPSGKYLPEMLAGYATREWLPGLGTSIQDLVAAGLIYGSGVGLTPHMLFGAAAASPKVVGVGMRGLGAVKGLGDIAGTVANPAVRNIISRVNEAGLPEPAPLEGTQQAAGGRIGRKAGGRIGAPSMAAEKLIVAAERAKKNQGNATSALLNVPDEAITKALAVANEHI